MAPRGQKEEHRSLISVLFPLVKHVDCEPIAHSEYVHRADSETLREVFNKYTSIEKESESYMSYEDFVRRFLGLLTEDNYNPDTVKRLANCLDTNKNGLISYMEFQAFEALLCAPDAIYAMAFQMFDSNSSGFVSYSEFESFVKETEVFKKIPFTFDCNFISLHFGKDRERRISYAEFTQLIHSFHEEHALQAFYHKDEAMEGYISPLDFHEIMTQLKGHLLTNFVEEHLVRVAGGGKGSLQVSYPYFIAFISLLNNMELVKQIYTTVSKGQLTKEITKEEFLHEAQQFTQITPLEVDILFHLVDLKHQTGRAVYSDLLDIAPLSAATLPYQIQAQMKAMQEKVIDIHAGTGRGVLVQVFENVYRFTLGSVAGAIGATTVYPIDLVKTRMQNQRAGSYVGEVMYRNSFDCAKKVIRHEGVLGLYRGLGPQLVGVAPEKAIKLTMNDLMRDKLSSKNGEIPLWAELLAGGCAGASQVMFTNPLEIVKIRLQVAGEVVSKQKIRAGAVIKSLGFFGLYKGARACFCRDIPFSAIYFTLYSHLKKYTADENGYNSAGTLLLSATLSGAPAASLTTPFDVIKTRLQVVAREGQTTYNGVIDCARKIWKEEGGRAFWKGAPARVLRSSPQFGVTLLTYEILQRALYVDFGGRKPTGSAISQPAAERIPDNPDHIGGYRLALACFDGIETKFGLSLPKYQRMQTGNAS